MAGSERSKSYLVECYWPGVSEEVLAAAWRGFVQASTYETTEGVEIVLCSCSPWLCVPISDGPKQRSARHRPDWGAARETGRTP
jgi:hypothetical protein